MLATSARPFASEGLISLNRLFRWLVMLLGYLFLLAFWQFSQNGRYAVFSNDQGAVGIDTRTGEVTFPTVNIPKGVQPVK